MTTNDHIRHPLPAGLRNAADLDLIDADLLGGDPSIPLVDTGPPGGIQELLAARRSGRHFDSILSSQVVNVLARTLIPSSRSQAADGYFEMLQPAPTAGGRSPHTLLLVANAVTGLEQGSYAVRGGDAPMLLRLRLDESTRRLNEAACASLGATTSPAALIVSLARFRRTISKYPWGQTLVWRDAGALLATMHLIAFDLRLESRILGLFETVQIPIIGTSEFLVDTGALALGVEA